MRSAIVSLIAFISACTTVDSSDIKTHGIKPAMTISSSAEAPGSNVTVSLHVGDSPTTFVELQDGESITATPGTEAAVTLTKQSLLGVTDYVGALDTQVPGTSVTIDLTRPTDTNAPASTVTLTEKLTLTSPAAGSTASRANNDVTVAWTDSAPSPDAVKVAWTGDCVQDGSLDVEVGKTSATIAKGTVLKKTGDNIPDNCDVTFSASRTHAGTVDPAFGGGSIAHVFSSSAKVTSNP
jgi:hypothetical protein